MDIPPARDVSFGDIPFQRRWEHLRDIIKDLYLDRDMKLSEVVKAMKDMHGFDAGEDQYKYHFKKWKISKILKTSTKRKLLAKGEQRADAGKRTAFSVQGRPADARKLLREVKSEISKMDIALKTTMDRQKSLQQLLPGFSYQLGPSIFMAWNMPYGAMKSFEFPEVNHSSPFGQAVSTPSDIIVSTPRTNDANSPNNAPSPLTKALTMRKSIDRAKMFAEGKFNDLIESMDKEEAIVMSTWLYQFWFFAFKTAKHWGIGPRYWNAGALSFSEIQELLPRTPRTEQGEGPGHTTLSDYRHGNEEAQNTDFHPSSLCNWAIHYECEIEYDVLPELSESSGMEIDPQDEQSWTEWPESWREPPLHERLACGLQSNDFSIISTADLPVAVPQIIKATEKAPDVLLREALGFAIMGRNHNLVRELLENFPEKGTEISSLYPFHLATSFLDGVTSCCNILYELIDFNFNSLTVPERRELYVNDLGHTVFDNLMIRILKSHTSTTPSVVNKELRHQKRFAGEEVDVCGRWDADSECFRGLLARGKAEIPVSWKHKFCHTSVQAVCHCIFLFKSSRAFLQYSDTPSGLFLEHCWVCGLKMQLEPLHTLVVTAFQLASCGSPDEDLFGILACLLYLFDSGVDPLKKADISAQWLFSRQDNDVSCTHEQLTPAELAYRVPATYVESWSSRAKTGWEVFRLILWLAQTTLSEIRESDAEDSSEDKSIGDEEYYYDCNCGREHSIMYARQPSLGILYAAVQTELLTYRRLQEGDPWISENFDLSGVLHDLQRKEYNLPSLGLINKALMRPFCKAGHFVREGPFLEAADTCVHYFSNMDVWSRAKFIEFHYSY